MTPGNLARRLLGPAFRPVGEAYRRIFVDMDKVADWMADRLPRSARVLDVGGGDGYVANLLLARRADIRVTLIDPSQEIGSFIDAAHLDRVTLRPGTMLDDVSGEFDVIILVDVAHHISLQIRPQFFASLAATAGRIGCRSIVIKDILPGGLRAKLAIWSDWYITGDRDVRLLGPGDFDLPGFELSERAMPDFPNYGIVLRSQ
jgi:SAM-dependent methyltransferase